MSNSSIGFKCPFTENSGVMIPWQWSYVKKNRSSVSAIFSPEMNPRVLSTPSGYLNVN